MSAPGTRPSRPRLIARVTVLALMVAGLAVVDADRAIAAQVGCGDTITSSTTLHRDLLNCPDTGIVIGADNLTLDLNGHRIDGDAALVDACPEGDICDVGILNQAGHTGITIKGGSITDFAVGVFVQEASDNSLRRLTVSKSQFAGVVIQVSSRTLVEESVVSRNGLTTAEAGLLILAAPDTHIVRNRVSGNGAVGVLALSAERNRIAGNVVTDHPEAGLVIEGVRTKVSENRVRRNGDGIILTGDDNVVARNLVADAPGCAENGEIGCGYGISFEGGSRNLLADNTVVRARRADIRLEAFAGETRDNIVRGNIVRAAGVDGIQVNVEQVGPVDNTLVDRNVAVDAQDDGIDVRSPATTITRNRAVRNGDLGIEAVAGVTDGGGNRAAANGDPRQCTNVTCG